MIPMFCNRHGKCHDTRSEFELKIDGPGFLRVPINKVILLSLTINDIQRYCRFPLKRSSGSNPVDCICRLPSFNINKAIRCALMVEKKNGVCVKRLESFRLVVELSKNKYKRIFILRTKDKNLPFIKRVELNFLINDQYQMQALLFDDESHIPPIKPE